MGGLLSRRYGIQHAHTESECMASWLSAYLAGGVQPPAAAEVRPCSAVEEEKKRVSGIKN